MDHVNDRGLAMLGCGKMGSAMLDGWIAAGLIPRAVHIIDPAPAPHLQNLGVNLNSALPDAPAVLVIAVKPQMMRPALDQVAQIRGPHTLVISVAAGVPLATFESAFGADTPIVRAMPNTPAAIGKGITAMVGNMAAGAEALDLAETLLSSVGQVVRLQDEAQMDAVTALSGSGPAYVFHMIEALAAAGVDEGLPPETALHLARATVAGAGALAEAACESPQTLRQNVTSPGGTTQAALEVLMAPDGLAPLIRRAVAAASDRSRELANG